MQKRISSTIALSTILLVGTNVLAGTFGTGPLIGDVDSGIGSAVPYTSVIDFNGTGSRTVNGVTFRDTGTIGNFYNLAISGAFYPGFPNAATGSMNGLLNDFIYTGDGSGNATLTLGGLTVGQQYTTTWYNAGFGPAGGRQINITPSDTGIPFLFDENFSGDGIGNKLTYTFTATAKFITYAFDALSNGDSFHHYALTNSGLAPNIPAPVSPVVTDALASSASFFQPFTVSNNDLLQTSVASVTSNGTFNLEGTGGVPILNNGTFSITGIGGNNPELATGQNGSSVTFDLNTTVNIFGYDITSIAGYGGWNDSGRDRQMYNIFLSFVGDPTYFLFGGINDDVDGAGGNPSASRAVFTPSSPLSGVDSIRIEFLNGQENGHAGYGEFDVIGGASVPEPGSIALLLSSLLGVATIRRRGSTEQA